MPTSSYAHLWIAICSLRTSGIATARFARPPRPWPSTPTSPTRGSSAPASSLPAPYDAAVAELRTAVETDPAKPMVRLDLARVLGEAGRTDEARAEYATILKLQPDDVSALIGLAALEARTGALDEAAAGFARALAVDPRQAQARFDLAEVRRRQGRVEEAEAEFQRLIDDPQTPPGIRESARRARATLGR